MLWPSCGVYDCSHTIIVKYDHCAFERYIDEISPVMHHWAALFSNLNVKIHSFHFKVGRLLITIVSNVAQGEIKPFWAKHDEWRHSLKMVENYEDDYLKNIISKQNHVVS